MRFTRFFCLWIFIVIGSAVCGCATLPDVSEILEDVPAEGQPPEIVSAKGPLPQAQSKAIIKKIKRFSGVSDIVERQTLALQAVSGRPLVSGNKVTLLVDGPATYAAMLKAIDDAKHDINLETFIYEDDEIGRRFAEAFLKKKAEGVQVNIIYDSVGSKNTPPAFFQQLRGKGINVLEFNPVNPLLVPVGQSHLTQRDHRKVLVVDGSIAFTGGVNISHVYSGRPSGMSGEHERQEMKKEEAKEPWRDTHVRIEGPAVSEFQQLFLETWKDKKGPQLEEKDFFPQLKKQGNEFVQVVGSAPGEQNRITFVMFVAAFLNAQRSIHINTPYFVPDGQTVSALIDAAKRGLDVKIILPEVSDSKLTLSAGHYYYSTLLKAGVKLYERQHVMIHAKTCIVDGVWSTVGSTNMDLWSFLHNNEVNAIIIGSDFASEMETLFENDLKESKEVVIDEWRKRPLFPRIGEWFAHLFRHYL
ncbi:Phospholipase D/Transphosphatidylase [Candidatus Sulfobium mesophilum]|uniref:Cardiolipin synthase n=1 Tax=Candidatus Sulfobium mesophilum TaxID=2016548 RepID=A0A2U3QHI3_9BACT|nr:Phospholipase D/Transphosphatidylase [Candidatus Sulfobium mesophilum]